jgi:DNA-binding IclR family transcriptional regulator
MVDCGGSIMAKRGVKRSKEAPTPVSYATPALDKGLDILELLAHERDGLTKSEIARALERTVSEIFRMLLCLERRGYLSEVAEDRYVLSLRLFQLVQEHPPTERLLTEALPRMHALAERSQQSCHLGVLEAGRVVILAQTNTPGSVGFYVKAGSSVDLMEAASGQAILAHLPPEAATRVLKEWQKETGGTVPADLGRHLERIRRRGHEKRASYQVRGVTNISYPVVDANNRAVAALTVPYIQRVPERIGLKEVEDLLAETAKAISTAMGAR